MAKMVEENSNNVLNFKIVTAELSTYDIATKGPSNTKVL